MFEIGAVDGLSAVSFAIAAPALTMVFMLAMTMSDHGDEQLRLWQNNAASHAATGGCKAAASLVSSEDMARRSCCLRFEAESERQAVQLLHESIDNAPTSASAFACLDSAFFILLKAASLAC